MPPNQLPPLFTGGRRAMGGLTSSMTSYNDLLGNVRTSSEGRKRRTRRGRNTPPHATILNEHGAQAMIPIGRFRFRAGCKMDKGGNDVTESLSIHSHGSDATQSSSGVETSERPDTSMAAWSESMGGSFRLGEETRFDFGEESFSSHAGYIPDI